MSALNLIREDLAFIEPYIKQAETPNCKLDANELPWSPISSALSYNRYPNFTPICQLQKQLADFYNVEPSSLLLTRGSDEGLDLLMRLFLKTQEDSILQFPPTFSMYAFFAKLNQAYVVNCPLEEKENGFSLNVENIKQPCKLILLCRPNNPTGNTIDLPLIADLCTRFRNQSIVVVDEAYIEFSDALSATTLIQQFDNLIVLRTLSKACGLAGLRLGSIIAQSAIIEAFNKITVPYPLSSAVVNLGLKALKNRAWFDKTKARIQQMREKLACNLQKSPFIEKVYPSEANFILVKTPYAQALFDWFNENQISVRLFMNTSLLPHHLRITVGSLKQNRQLLTILQAFRGDLDEKDTFYR